MDKSRNMQRGVSFSKLDPVLMQSRVDRKSRREERMVARATVLKQQEMAKQDSFEATTISPTMSTRLDIVGPHCPPYPKTPGPIGAKYIAPKPKKWLKSMKDLNAKYIEDLKFCKFNTVRLPEPPLATRMDVKTESPSTVTLMRRLSTAMSSLRRHAEGTSASMSSFLVNQNGVPDDGQQHQQEEKTLDQADASEDEGSKNVRKYEVMVELNLEAVKFICKDMRPIKTLEGAGFKDLAQKLIDIGAKYGSVSIEDYLLPRNILVKGILKREYSELRSETAAAIRPFIDKQTLGFTVNFWTDSNFQISYMTVSCHLIDESTTLKNYLVCLEPLSAHCNTSSDHLRKFILNKLKKSLRLKNAQLAALVDGNNLTFVVENGEDVATAALRDFKQIECAYANINLAMQYFFETLDKNNEYNTVIDSCMDLVEYVKSSELHQQLDFKLKQPSSLSRIPALLETICSGFELLQDALLENNELQRLDIDKTTLLELTRLLKPFEIAAQELLVTDTPTLHLVLPWKRQIENSLEKQADDPPSVSLAKEILLEGVRKRFTCDELHQCATFLDPRMKQFKNIYPDEAERKKVFGKIREVLLIKYCDGTGENEIAELESASNRSIRGSLSSTSTIHSLFDNAPSDGNKDEFRRYLDLEVSTPSLDVLQFWQEHKEEFPSIYKMAKDVLGIPAALACTERSFGLTAEALRKRRNVMKRSNVAKILFLNYSRYRDDH